VSPLRRIEEELARATKKYPPMNSAHEAYAFLLEEVDELWEEVKVKQSKHDYKAMRDECVQIGAMAARFIRDVCDPKIETDLTL